MRSEKGQSLMEVVVALTVGILVVTALTFATLFSFINASFSKASVQATKLAQEGLERVRSSRDKNAKINPPLTINGDTIDSWNNPDLWSNQIGPNCAPNCYFNVDADGTLKHLTAAASIPSGAEQVGQFRRVITLSDDLTSYSTQKKVTAIVTWTDAAGSHESKLTTILGKL